MLRKNRISRDRSHLFNTDIRWWINFQEIQIQTRGHRDHNRQQWEGYCEQRSDRFLKLTPVLQVLVTRRHLASGGSFQDVCGELIGVVQTEPPVYLEFSVGNVIYPTDIDFQNNPTCTSLYGVCHCLIVGSEHIARSNATFSNKTLIPCSQQNLLSASPYVSAFLWLSKTWKSQRKSRYQQNFNAADQRWLAADKARPIISIEFSTSFACEQSWTYPPFSKSELGVVRL